ncbi:winged helix-turn-helix transcriptional regulator [Halomonas coralii]|nr:winged helix-turn-helix transcriptional regulator [Modicisalibacter sp. R2A 31.J]MBZ9576046.1 winged helix-turn-helix transcriptional regulator [Modicisalibacter sp. MOD 31.J]
MLREPDASMRHAVAVHDVIWQLAFQFKIATKQAIRDYGLSLNGMHMHLLRRIRDRADCTANRLAQDTRRDKAQITRTLKELEGMGLITRSPNPRDGRSQIVALSDTGQALMRRTDQVERDVAGRLLEGLSEAEVTTFLGLAHRMLDNLDTA